MAVSDQDFKNALKLWASGVTVVTSQSDKHGLKGMTATSFSSVSMEPPQILVCVNQATDTGEVILDCEKFAVNVLTTDQESVSNQFAGGATQEERFASVKWREGEIGMPVFEEALASIECTLVEKVLAGTHWVMIGQVEKVHCREGEPLLYYNSGYCSTK